jgi:hypothetical protein
MEAFLCLLLLSGDGGGSLPKDPPGKERLPAKVTTYVGSIYFYRNVHTDQSDIREVLTVGSGRRFDPVQVWVSEWRMLLAFPDRFAWWNGKRPRIYLAERYGEGDMRFQDLHVEFDELKKR